MSNVVAIGRESFPDRQSSPGHSAGLLTRNRNVPEGRYEWLDDALCAQIDQDAFFPEKGQSHTILKKVCGECAVRRECLEDALWTGDVYDGVRGGLGPIARRRLLIQNRKG